MNGWEITIIVFNSMVLGASLIQDGKPRTGKVSFWRHAGFVAITFYVLYKAGLFQ